jgi:hypothetical protein
MMAGGPHVGIGNDQGMQLTPWWFASFPEEEALIRFMTREQQEDVLSYMSHSLQTAERWYLGKETFPLAQVPFPTKKAPDIIDMWAAIIDWDFSEGPPAYVASAPRFVVLTDDLRGWSPLRIEHNGPHPENRRRTQWKQGGMRLERPTETLQQQYLWPPTEGIARRWAGTTATTLHVRKRTTWDRVDEDYASLYGREESGFYRGICAHSKEADDEDSGLSWTSDPVPRLTHPDDRGDRQRFWWERFDSLRFPDNYVVLESGFLMPCRGISGFAEWIRSGNQLDIRKTRRTMLVKPRRQAYTTGADPMVSPMAYTQEIDEEEASYDQWAREYEDFHEPAQFANLLRDTQRALDAVLSQRLGGCSKNCIAELYHRMQWHLEHDGYYEQWLVVHRSVQQETKDRSELMRALESLHELHRRDFCDRNGPQVPPGSAHTQDDDIPAGVWNRRRESDFTGDPPQAEEVVLDSWDDATSRVTDRYIDFLIAAQQTRRASRLRDIQLEEQENWESDRVQVLNRIRQRHMMLGIRHMTAMFVAVQEMLDLESPPSAGQAPTDTVLRKQWERVSTAVVALNFEDFNGGVLKENSMEYLRQRLEDVKQCIRDITHRSWEKICNADPGEARMALCVDWWSDVFLCPPHPNAVEELPVLESFVYHGAETRPPIVDKCKFWRLMLRDHVFRTWYERNDLVADTWSRKDCTVSNVQADAWSGRSGWFYMRGLPAHVYNEFTNTDLKRKHSSRKAFTGYDLHQHDGMRLVNIWGREATSVDIKVLSEFRGVNPSVSNTTMFEAAWPEAHSHWFSTCPIVSERDAAFVEAGRQKRARKDASLLEESINEEWENTDDDDDLTQTAAGAVGRVSMSAEGFRRRVQAIKNRQRVNLHVRFDSAGTATAVTHNRGRRVNSHGRFDSTGAAIAISQHAQKITGLVPQHVAIMSEYSLRRGQWIRKIIAKPRAD